MFFAHPALSQKPQPAALDETAFAIPRISGPGSLAEVSLPTPLSPSDVALARQVFTDLAAGHLQRATREQAEMQSPLLNGAILAARDLGPHHVSTVAELRDWLAHYDGQADTAAIVALLQGRDHDAASPQAQLPASLQPQNQTGLTSADPLPRTLIPEPAPHLEQAVQQQLKRQDYAAALRLIAVAKQQSPAAKSLLRAAVARDLFTHNQDVAALQVAAEAWHAAPADQRVGRAAFVAGLSAWRLGRVEVAGIWFTDAARAPAAAPGLRAAGAFWAARTALRRHDLWGYHAWLRQAAGERRTFYGLVARRILGWSTGLLLGHDILSEADLEALSELPRAVRAFALIQVGQTARAEAELRALWPEVADSAPLRRALLLVAVSAHMPDLAVQLADLVQQADGVPHDTLRFSVPRLSPAGGFIVDPALVYGLTRIESNFQPAAVSPAGASGLMQLTPAAARSVTGNPRLTEAALHNPALNLGVGQKLLLELAARPDIHGDLVRLLAAYNAGPANLASWDGQIRAAGDPFLFIEAIPIAETRRFVRGVLASSWIYAARLGLPAPGLDDFTAGRAPQLIPVIAPPPDRIRLAGSFAAP